MLQRHSKFLHITGELFDPFIVGLLHGLGQEPDLAGQLLHLADLPGPDAGALLVEDVLQLHGEDLGVLEIKREVGSKLLMHLMKFQTVYYPVSALEIR